MDKIFLITGCNSGLGYQLTQKLLSLKKTVIGVSKTKKKIFNKQFHYIKHDLRNKIDDKSIKKINLFFKNKSKIQIIINAAVDIDDLKGKKLDYEKTLKQIYINFINQYLLIAKILNKSKNNQINICLISSVNIFLFDKVFSLGYNLSKSLQFELYKFLLTRFKNYNVKIVFLSGMQTKMYSKTLTRKFKNNSYLYNKKIKKALNVKSVANGIIHFINNSKKKALFLPKKYKFALIFHYFIKTFNILK